LNDEERYRQRRAASELIDCLAASGDRSDVREKVVQGPSEGIVISERGGSRLHEVAG
jgi:hypothetical protein